MVSIVTWAPSEKDAKCGLSATGRGLLLPAEQPFMPELAAMLVRSSIGTLPPVTTSCEGCRRTPLAGERLHELDGGRVLCELCFAGLPEERRLAVRTERVHASERRLVLVHRAA
jgi:hypothetical protein